LPELHLTELGVKSLKGSDRSVSYWDDVTPGFCVRVGKRAKTWCVVRGRNRERVVIGRFPDMQLSDARAEAKRLLSAEPEPRSVAITFGKAREEFLEEHYRGSAPRTKYNTERLLVRHFKAIEHKKLAAIEDADLKRRLDALKATPSEQLHAYRAVRCFLRWCVRPPRRYLKHSPMEGYLPPGVDRKGTRILSDEELVAVWKASETYPASVLRLLILWGTRNTETCVSERSWESDGVLTIPGAATKNGRDHAIPILSLARSILDGLPANKRHFFRSRWGDTHLSVTGLAKAQREVKAASGTMDWQIRDLRRTFRSNMARLGVPRDLCEVLINHAPPVLDEIYDRYDRIVEKRAALAKYEAFIHTLVARDQPGARELPLREFRDETVIEEGRQGNMPL